MLSLVEQIKLLIWMIFAAIRCVLCGEFGKANCVAAWMQILLRGWLAITYVDGSWGAITYVFVALLVSQFIGMAPTFSIMEGDEPGRLPNKNVALFGKMIFYPALVATVANLALLGIGSIYIQYHSIAPLLYSGALLNAFAGAVDYFEPRHAGQSTDS